MRRHRDMQAVRKLRGRRKRELMGAIESSDSEMTEVRPVIIFRDIQDGVVATAAVRLRYITAITGEGIGDGDIEPSNALRRIGDAGLVGEMNALVERASARKVHDVRSHQRIDAAKRSLLFT